MKIDAQNKTINFTFRQNDLCNETNSQEILIIISSKSQSFRFDNKILRCERFVQRILKIVEKEISKTIVFVFTTIFANNSINSNLSNAKITTIMIFQIVSMRSNKNAKIKTKSKYFVFEWISNQKEIANSNFWQRERFRVKVISFFFEDYVLWKIFNKEKLRVRMISFFLKITIFEKFSIEKDFVFEWFRFCFRLCIKRDRQWI